MLIPPRLPADTVSAGPALNWDPRCCREISPGRYGFREEERAVSISCLALLWSVVTQLPDPRISSPPAERPSSSLQRYPAGMSDLRLRQEPVLVGYKYQLRDKGAMCNRHRCLRVIVGTGLTAPRNTRLFPHREN